MKTLEKLRFFPVFFPLLFAFFASSVYAVEWETSANLRERFQYFDDLDFNDSVNDEKWEWDNRLYLNLNAKIREGLRVYFQPQAVYIYTDLPNGDDDFSQGDLYQAFLEYKREYPGADVAVKLGRQTLVYGDQRLLGHLGWKDIARTFDGLKVSYHRKPVKLDLFYVHPADIVSMEAGESLTNWEDRTLTGAYGTVDILPNVGLELYFINWDHSDKADLAPGRDINTYGGRIFGKWKSFDATGEAVWQTGRWVKGTDQDAQALALKAGYTFEYWKTRVGVEYDFSPGDDDATDNDHETFVFPFHTNHMHYGEMDRFSWANMRDLRFSLKTVPTEGLTLLADVHLLELDEPEDNWLNVAGTGLVNPVFGPGDPAFDEEDAGTEVDLKAVYKVKSIKGLKLVALYAFFAPGDAVEERNSGNDDGAQFGYFIAQIVF
jgi:hypothetical protein